MSTIALEIFVDDPCQRSGKSRVLSSQIVLHIGDASFPTKGWHDMSALVLSGIVAAVDALRDSRGSQAVAHFFEGPYMLRLRRGSAAGALHAEAVERASARERIHAEWTTTADDLLLAVQAAVRHLQELVPDFGNDSDEKRLVARFATS